MKVYDRDPNAEAVMLNDFAIAEFVGNRLSIRYHVRIKLLHTTGFSWGDVNIPYYAKGNLQNVAGLKAQTINFENGKEVTTKVEAKSFFDAELGDGWMEKRFSLPSLKEGSIIEYQYTLTSKSFFYLRNWNFQNTIPTVHSEFRAKIPQALTYNVIFQGQRTIAKYRDKLSDRWVLTYLPALKKEPYMTTTKDYMEMIRFQLAGYISASGAYTESGYQSTIATWDALTDEIYDFEKFGQQLSRNRLAKEVLDQLSLPKDDPLQMVRDIYSHVQTHMAWNGDYSIFAEGSLRNALEDGKTNSGGVGLFLTLLLQEAGFEAYPVLISTRNHGYVSKGFPLLSQFNHLLVQVECAGKKWILDATDPLRPIGLLAKNDLNRLGLLVSKKHHEWIEILPPMGNKQTAIVTVDLANLENPKYDVDLWLEGYYSLTAREKLKEENEKSFTSSLFRSELSFNKVNLDNQETIEQPLKFDLSGVAPIESNGDLIYFQPYILNDYLDNPFKAEKRQYPIDFGSLSKETYVLIITIPEGYAVEELPENAVIKLPKDNGSFSFLCQLKGDQLKLQSKITINKALMHPLLYPSLKEFYDLIISKLGEQIVLKVI